MFDANPALPDLSLLIAPGDEAELLGTCTHTDATGRSARNLVYVALHRDVKNKGAETWTHVYRVAAGRRPGDVSRDVIVFFAKALPGDQRSEAAAWARETFAL